MLHNEARELLVKGYEKSRDAEVIAQAYSVSERTVYRLAQQKRETGSVALRTSQRGRKPALTEENKRDIRQCVDESPDSTVNEIRESVSVNFREFLASRDKKGYTVFQIIQTRKSNHIPKGGSP